MMSKILHAADHDDLSIFGKNPCHRLVQFYGMDGGDVPQGEESSEVYVEKQFKYLLKHIAKEIRAQILNWPGTESRAPVQYFTHIEEREEYIPWDKEFDQPGHLDELELEPISQKWFQLLNPPRTTDLEDGSSHEE